MRRRRRGSLLLAALASGLGLASACSRSADVSDDPTAGLDLGPMAPFDEAQLVDVDAAFGEPPFAACAERPTGACVGVNDFPCDFGGWLTTEVDRCQAETGCRANGWVVADMGANGCVERLRLSEPAPALAECLVEALGGYRCPCGAENRRRFLGVDNQPCLPGERACGPNEFPCPLGQVCEQGVCVLEPGSE